MHGVDQLSLKRQQLLKRLTELAPQKRLDAMLEEVDGRVLVRSLPAEDVYSAILDAGLADATEIVQLATPAQFRTFVDLAAWSRDRVDPLEVLRWLRAARGDDDDEYVAKIQALDIEMIELLYKKLTVVHDLEEDPDANPAGITMETPEGKFLLEFLVEGVDEAAIRRLTQDLTAKNPFEIARFLEAVRWELPSELEEVAYQFRQSRLHDLGFPPLEEAMRLFAWVDPGPFKPSGKGEALLAPGVSRPDFVEAAFRGLDQHEREVLETEIRYLVNSALVAEGAEPGDPRAIRRVSEAARDYLDLGLEHLCGGEPGQASELVREQTLKRCFQVGFSLTLRLRRQVERMASEPMAKFADTWLALEEETAVIQALLRRRPLKALKVSGAEPVPFRSRRELAESEAVLERVRRQRPVLKALLGASPADVVSSFGVSFKELTPQRLWAAAVARAIVGEPPIARPLPAIKLTELAARVFDGGRLNPSAVKLAAAAFEGEEVPAMVERVLQAFVNEAGPAWQRDLKLEAKRIMSVPIEGELPI